MADPRALSERELLARAIQSEAGGEGYEGQVAVGAVIDNRRRAGNYGGSYSDVILAPGQFSAFNNYTGYMGGAGSNDAWQRTPSDSSYSAADAILSGQYEDPTGGAVNYYNPSAASPSWGGGDGWQRIGNHVFGTAGGGGGGGGGGNYTRSTKGGSMDEMSNWDRIMAEAPQAKARSPLASALMAFAENAPRMYKGQGMDFGGPDTQVANRTLQWLVAAGRKDLAAAVSAGGMSPEDAVKQAYADRKGGKEVDPKNELDAMKAYRGEDDFATYQATRNAYEKMRATYNQILANPTDTSGLPDVALIFAYMKMLDPASTVREGEVATVANAGGVAEGLRGLYNKLTGSGGQLSNRLRGEIVGAADRYYQEAAGNLAGTNKTYGDYAGRYGIDGGFIQQPETYDPLGPLPPQSGPVIDNTKPEELIVEPVP